MATSGCETTKRATEALRPDLEHPDWFDCAKAQSRPTIPPEFKIDWTQIATVDQAKVAHDNFVLALRGREKIVADYALGLEAINFNCWNDTQAQLDFYKGLPPPPGR